ncbi:MAG: response regulator transcription factor [Evtepia sp.]|uniref:response regulator transcription factor n=1 Tax=Evtepia sp. TaxID=2773933 RepID=UPI002A74B335|nr:response regulator transcription factor [Evtepia sp.]MDY3013856.1 response regulator transcription factor [Evtepia sp.]
MSQILLVEDDMSLGAALEFSLSDEGFTVERARTLAQARISLQGAIPDVILLDVNLPDGSGYDLCKEIRQKSPVPIIFLTALDEEVNVVMGLELGANDYLTKPFGVRELIARIKVQLRTSQNKSKSLLSSRDIVVDLSQMTASKARQALSLTPLEYKLLVMMMQNPMKVMKREKILEAISGSEGSFFDENTLSVYIKRLREKIEDDPKVPALIITKRGAGYQWNAEVKSE